MLPITRMISEYNHYDYNDPKYIIIHYTGNEKDTAKANANYFNTADRSASAHYFVDDSFIYQVVEDYCGAWHIGNSVTDANNQNSIGIEMCTSSDYIVSETTENNTVELVKYLMDKYGISIENVTTHFGVSGKVCPNWSSNGWERWSKFLDKVKGNIPVIEPAKEVIKEVVYDMKSLVVYGNSIDRRAAEYLADFLKCPTIDGNIPFDYSKVENVICVGGKPSLEWTSYADKIITGSDRFNTMIEVLKFIGKL